MGSISHHSVPLVITSLGGEHRHRYKHTLRRQDQFLETRHAPGIKIISISSASGALSVVKSDDFCVQSSIIACTTRAHLHSPFPFFF